MEYTSEEIRGYVRSGVIRCGGHPVVADGACAAFDAIVADANRYRAVKAMVCETNKSAQGRMLAAMKQFEPARDMFNEDSCTPEQFDTFADSFVVVIQGARDADR